jgi:DNA-binding NarL/FixJ family response regulator
MTTTTAAEAPGPGTARRDRTAGPGPAATGPAALTAREREVARMIPRGLSTRRIAAPLAVSGRTVEWHVANILRKLGLRSRVQIAVWALHDEEGA